MTDFSLILLLAAWHASKLIYTEHCIIYALLFNSSLFLIELICKYLQDRDKSLKAVYLEWWKIKWKICTSVLYCFKLDNGDWLGGVKVINTKLSHSSRQLEKISYSTARSKSAMLYYICICQLHCTLILKPTLHTVEN